jgi:hypothetical protein
MTSPTQNYGFMKSGGGEAAPLFNIDENEIRQLLSLFISNAIINASRYAKICKRNGVTKTDINLGLMYEIREFFNRTTIANDIEEIKRDYENLQNEQPVKFKVEYIDTRTGTINLSDSFDDEDIAEDYICELEKEDYYTDFTIVEITDSDLMMEDMVVEDNEIQPFSKVSIENIRDASHDDRQFVSKVHTYENQWESWEPETPILAILKNGAIKMMEANV